MGKRESVEVVRGEMGKRIEKAKSIKGRGMRYADEEPLEAGARGKTR